MVRPILSLCLWLVLMLPGVGCLGQEAWVSYTRNTEAQPRSVVLDLAAERNLRSEGYAWLVVVRVPLLKPRPDGLPQPSAEQPHG